MICTTIQNLTLEQIYEALDGCEMAESMTKDKKAEAGKVHFVLLNEIGDVITYALTVDEVVKLLK